MNTIRTLAELKLPPVLGRIAEERAGLVLVSGCVASGKTTTLYALLDSLIESGVVKVFILERQKQAIAPANPPAFRQWELGRDFMSFAHGIRRARRESAEVIMVEDVADCETLESCMPRKRPWTIAPEGEQWRPP